MKISIIGAGRLGGALALALSKKGYRIENLVVRRRLESAEKVAGNIQPRPQILIASEIKKLAGSEIIFITTQDSEIASVAENLAANLPNKPFIFHTSGVFSSEILEDLSRKGFPVGSIHPLVSVSDSLLGGAERFKNVFFCIEGDAEAVTLARKIVADLKGKSFHVETKFKTLYHAAAVTASGHVTALVSIAVEMLAACGLSSEKSLEILLPLINSTVKNLESQTPSRALTGTFARADAQTMIKHLEAIRDNAPREALEVYRQLGLQSVGLAEMNGADVENLALMKNILEAEKEK